MRTRTALSAIVSIALLALLAGCAGDGSTLPPLQPSGPEPAFPPTFANIQANVLTPSCAVTGCHTTADQSGGLDLSTGNSYAAIVNFPSLEMPAIDRVEPSNPGASYLMQKLDASPGIAEQPMPLGQPRLPAEVREAIRQWIAQGAPNN